ncbi:hypothetical protein M426DRAFT_12778 [Hypoxylon sp. CI-4A]|nr:hypothetical protein M426DRAFT_12778 [Hypoxylon sp. CI-4A]
MSVSGRSEVDIDVYSSIYLGKVYAGVLGKLIGVYMGRPIEGWTHQQILTKFGHIRYFVNRQLGLPLVVTDDDISGTFTFIRAIEEHYHGGQTLNGNFNANTGNRNIISAENIGKTWLNNVIKNRTVFWWGGNGVSTEHTAFLNLKKGIKAPRSGAIKTNGKAIAEQIGAQIFIDGWGMVAPTKPEVASKLAEAAGSVSHDGESVYAAKMWAAMEAEAFISDNIDHLIDTGLQFIPQDSFIATLVREVRSWSKMDGDWLETRQKIEDKYGYDKFPGLCHVVPNYGVMIMTLVYSNGDFDEAMHIANTSGWDTDCNSGNVGCLVAIMYGLDVFHYSDYDWRDPIADRVLISSADGGYSTNNAARIAFDIANMGRLLANGNPLQSPKDGAQFHFSLEGSVQGFQGFMRKPDGNKSKSEGRVFVTSDYKSELNIHIQNLTTNEAHNDTAEILTDTFTPPEVRGMNTYERVGSPLVSPGRTPTQPQVQVALIVKVYSPKDKLETCRGLPTLLSSGDSTVLRYMVPARKGGRPTQAVGIAITSAPGFNGKMSANISLKYLRWSGIPDFTLKPVDSSVGPAIFYKQSFVNGADTFDSSGEKFIVAQDQGEGIVSYGTREWVDYKAVFKDFIINKGGPCGVAVRVRGLNRYYALLFMDDDDDDDDGDDSDTYNNNSSSYYPKRVALVKALDDQRIEIASAKFDWMLDTPFTITTQVEGDEFRVEVSDVQLRNRDTQYPGGGIGVVATDGSVFVGSIDVGPAG